MMAALSFYRVFALGYAIALPQPINDDRVEGELTPERMRMILTELAEDQALEKPDYQNIISMLTPQDAPANQMRR